MAQVEYLGKKKRNATNSLCKGVIWRGKGDVQHVPDSTAAVMTSTWPGLFRVVDAGALIDDPVIEPDDTQEEEEEERERYPLVDLEAMDDESLRLHAQRYFNHQFHHNTQAPKMREVIVALMNKG